MANEKRLIDANALWAEAMNYADTGIEFDGEGVANFIANAPTVDAVPVVHGHWYKAPHYPYRCSCCGEMALLDMYGESHERSNYCPNCGADMRDGDGDGDTKD